MFVVLEFYFLAVQIVVGWTVMNKTMGHVFSMCGFDWLVHQLVRVALFEHPNMFPCMIQEDVRRAQSQGALS